MLGYTFGMFPNNFRDQKTLKQPKHQKIVEKNERIPQDKNIGSHPQDLEIGFLTENLKNNILFGRNFPK